MNDAVRLSITGRVQGVGYRAWLEGQALVHGLHGWVRNRRNGSVEALLIGAKQDVAKVVEACRQGPRLAAVANVVATPDRDDGSVGFRALPTA
jgi:acylphosphatase